MTNFNLNFSTGNTTQDFSLFDWATTFHSHSSHSIELGFTTAERIPSSLNKELITLLNSFENIYIHAPVKLADKWCTYPSPEMDEYIQRILHIMEVVEIKSVLFHPDLIEDFEYVNKLFGDKLSFENMDVKKNFGKTISDMRKVFEQSPQARWVCDLNHLYTLNNTMSNAKEWHDAFANRLTYYHLSAFGGFHSLFIDTHEDVIVKGILDTAKPVIHEGFSDPDVVGRLDMEIKYIKKIYENKILLLTKSHDPQL